MADRKFVPGLRRTSSANGLRDCRPSFAPRQSMSSTMMEMPSTTMMTTTTSITAIRSRRGNTQPRSTNSAASSPQVVNKPKLTAEQLLDICTRIQKGNYVKGAGFAQFYENGGNGPLGAGGAARNLFKDFEEAYNFRRKANEGEEVPPSSNEAGVDEGGDEAEEEEGADPALKAMWKEEKRYAKMPQYVKNFDKFMVARITNLKQVQKLATLRANRKFEEAFSMRKFVTLLKLMDKVTKVLSEYKDKTPWELYLLFKPDDVKVYYGNCVATGPSLVIDVREREKFLLAMSRAGAILEGLRGFPKMEQDWKVNFAKLDKVVNAFEDQIKEHEVLVEESRDLDDKDLKLNFNEDGSDSSSSGSGSSSSSPSTSGFSSPEDSSLYTMFPPLNKNN